MPKRLKDLRLNPQDEKRLRDAVQSKFDDAIYKRILQIIRDFKSVDFKPELLNSKTVYRNGISDVVNAITNGNIQYINGRFEGEFTATTSRELKKIGANWDRRLKAWHLPEEKLPMDIRLAVGTIRSAYQNMHDEILQSLDVDTATESLRDERLKPIFEQTLSSYEKQFQQATKAVSVPVKITTKMRDIITETFTENMNLDIERFAFSETKELRLQVEANMHQGGRAKNLEALLRKRYKTSQNKARFLAKQESGLLLAQYRKQRYRDAGVQRYRWRTSNDERVRDYHADLNGKIFFWDEAIIGPNGEKGNPKEYFGCRCTAEPILED